MSTEDELRVIQFDPKDEELTDFEWEGLPKTVRFEFALRYMSRMEQREALETIAGYIQKAIMATHEDRKVRTMVNNVAGALDDAQRANKKYRDIQTERGRKRN